MGPTGRFPPGIVIVAVPLTRTVLPEKVPPRRYTVPVGVGLPLPPLTATVTDSGRDAGILINEGVTFTEGVAFPVAVAVTVTELADVPDALV